MTFSEVVEAIKTLSLGEKEEIQSLLEQFLREEQRDEIYQNYLLANQNEKEGKLKSTNAIFRRIMIEISFDDSFKRAF